MDARSNRHVYLVYADRSLASYVCNRKDTIIDHWIYLGRDVLRCEEIKKIPGDRIKRYDIADSIQGSSMDYYHEYIDLIGSLAGRAEKTIWYLTSASEKSPFISNIFLYFCYYRAVIDYLEKEPGNPIIFCESASFQSWLADTLRIDTDLCVHSFDSGGLQVLRRGRELARELLQKSWFIARYSGRILYSNFLGPGPGNGSNPVFSGGENTVLIHSWADQRSFPENFRYLDVYLGDFGKVFRENAYRAGYIVNILPTLSYATAAKKLHQTTEHFMLFERYLSVLDPWIAVWQAGKQKNLSVQNASLGGVDITGLVRDELQHSSRLSRPALSYLFYCAGKRISGRSSPSVFILPFENQSWEKMLVMGLREKSPHPRIIGYAHSVVNRMEMFYSLSALEKESAPVPDIITVNGKKSRDVLIRAGFDERTILITGTLRKFHLKRKQPDSHGRPGKNILVALSIDHNRAAELVLKSLQSFRDLGNVNVMIKPHPTMKNVRNLPFISQIPPNFRIVTEPVHDLLDTCDLLLFSDSTVAIEALASSVPIIAVRSDFEFDMDLFEDVFPVPSARTPLQIRQVAAELLACGTASIDGFDDHLHEFFETPNPGRIRAFFDYLNAMNKT